MLTAVTGIKVVQWMDIGRYQGITLFALILAGFSFAIIICIYPQFGSSDSPDSLMARYSGERVVGSASETVMNQLVRCASLETTIWEDVKIYGWRTGRI